VFINFLVTIGDANYKYGNGYKHLASGLTCGLSSLVSLRAARLTKQNVVLPGHVNLGCWLRYRNCWWCRCARKRTTGSNLRRHDSYSHFRRGPRSLWYDRRYHPVSVSGPLYKRFHFQLPRVVVSSHAHLSLEQRHVRARLSLLID